MEYEIGAEESVTTAVVRTVSAVTGREPDALSPLDAVVDPDALDALFASTFDGTSRSGGHLSFVYEECRVTVDNGEYITVTLLKPLEADRHVGPSQRSDGDGT